MDDRTCALVGAAGGVGTTRLTLECASLLAADGRDVAVLDAAYGTQGLADRTPDRIDPDVTALCLDDAPLAEGFLELAVVGLLEPPAERGDALPPRLEVVLGRRDAPPGVTQRRDRSVEVRESVASRPELIVDARRQSPGAGRRGQRLAPLEGQPRRDDGDVVVEAHSSRRFSSAGDGCGESTANFAYATFGFARAS